MLRKVLFWLHLSAGVIAGIVILIMSVTGVLLTYEKQMIAWADRTDAALPHVASTPRQPIDALIAAARGGDPEVVVGNLTISSVPAAPALATVGSTVVKLNPYTGVLLGDSAPRLREFFRTVTTWHRYLGAANGPLRQTLRAVTGWSNLLFLFIVLGGIYLWLPKRWAWPHVRAVTLFRGGLQGKARDFNWHNVIGIWSAVPLVLVVAGALPISFPWANQAVYRVVGEEPPQQGGGRAGGPGAATAPAAQLEPLWQKAEQQVEGWRTIGARVGGNGPLVFTIDRGTGGQPQMRGTLTMNRATGEVVRWESFDEQSTGRQLRTFFRFAHTGEYFGIPGQTIAGLVTAGSVVLVWTGIALALRRLSAWRARRGNATAASSLRSHAA